MIIDMHNDIESIFRSTDRNNCYSLLQTKLFEYNLELELTLSRVKPNANNTNEKTFFKKQKKKY